MDERLRVLERAHVADPADQQAHAAVCRERGRAGLCPRCLSLVAQGDMSHALLHDSPLCWACYLAESIETLWGLVRDEVFTRIGTRVPWVSEADPTSRSIAFSVRRLLKGGRPAVCNPAHPGLTQNGPAFVITRESESTALRALYPVAIANEDDAGMIAVGFGLGTRRVSSREIGEVWSELRPKQEMHDGCYVVAHGRPVWEKNMRERLRDWANGEPRLKSPVDRSRIKAPRRAWKRWSDERAGRFRRDMETELRRRLPGCDAPG